MEKDVNLYLRDNSPNKKALANVLKLYYFVSFMGGGVFLPFLNLYLKEIGLSGFRIGIIAAGGFFFAALSQPVWGFVSDIFGTRKKILQLNLSLSLILIITLFFREDFVGLFIILILLRFLRSPLMRITDTITLTHPDIVYGKVRLWGSAGFAWAVVLAGKILQETCLKNFLYIFTVLVVLCLVISFYLPKDTKERRKRKVTRHKLALLIKNRAFSLFLTFSFLVGLSVSMNSTFFSIYLNELGANEGLIGLSWAIASLSNVPVFFYSDILLKRFGSTKLLFFGAILFGIRWLLYALISNPFFVLAIQAMQGISFALFYFSAVTFVSEIAPSELQVTGQGMFGAFFTFGLAGIAGSLIGGIIFDTLGISVMYGIGGVISILAAFFLFLSVIKPRSLGQRTT